MPDDVTTFRSSRGSYSSDVNLNTEDLGDSGVDTLESRGAIQPPPNNVSTYYHDSRVQLTFYLLPKNNMIVQVHRLPIFRA